MVPKPSLLSLPQGYDVTKENYAMVLERDGGFPLPTMLGFNEEGTPDGSVPFEDFMGPNGSNTTQVWIVLKKCCVNAAKIVWMGQAGSL